MFLMPQCMQKLQWIPVNSESDVWDTWAWSIVSAMYLYAAVLQLLAEVALFYNSSGLLAMEEQFNAPWRKGYIRENEGLQAVVKYVVGLRLDPWSSVC